MTAGKRSSLMPKTNNATLVRQNLKLVKQLYPAMAQRDLLHLRELTRALRLSLSQGEISCIDGRWYVTHAGLLRIALRARCFGIRTVLQERQTDPIVGRWVFRATVFKSPRDRKSTRLNSSHSQISYAV